MDRAWVPRTLVAAGIFLGCVMVAEVALIVRYRQQFTAEVVVTFVSSIPFVVALAAGGVWLSRSDVSPTRYRRVMSWVVAGFGFLVSLFAVIAFTTQDDWLVRLGILRWAAAVGAGTGLLVGGFEARAIERAVVADRVRVRNEELRRQNERLDQLASVIAHDLRNPLNVATGYLEVAQDDYDDDRLEQAVDALHRMEDIVDETLTLARSGRVIDDTETIDLRDVAEESWQNVATGDATLDVEASATITGDPNRVRHLLENLFRNAVEHAGADVTVRVGSLPSGFYVADDGPGIPVDDRPDVFDAGYTTTQDGTGFGLAIVKQIVDAHGGDVAVTDSEHGGARFETTGFETAPAARTDTASASEPADSKSRAKSN